MLWYRQCQVRSVDSLLQIYEKRTLCAEYEVYDKLNINASIVPTKLTLLYYRTNKKSKALLDYTTGRTPKMGMNLVYWQQIAQQKSEK